MASPCNAHAHTPLQAERETLLAQMRELQAQVDAQAEELQQYAASDPEALARLAEATQVR